VLDAGNGCIHAHISRRKKRSSCDVSLKVACDVISTPHKPRQRTKRSDTEFEKNFE